MASIIAPKAGTYPDPKMFVLTGQLPPYIDPSEPPTKKSPWRQISQTPYISSLTVVLPAELYESIWPRLKPPTIEAHYAKVFLKLEEILTGSFFTTYIKTPGSNIIMLSEGISGVDNIFSLRDGILRLDLVKEDYQRAGLQGKPIKTSGGRKHVKEYFRVEIDLRAPSMLKGKKGFERLLSASQNVLNGSLAWIFRDMSSSPSPSSSETSAISQHQPQIIDIKPQPRDVPSISVPDLIHNSQYHKLTQPPSIEFLDEYYEITEWIDLLTLSSPRVQQIGDPDPYISRYSIPQRLTDNPDTEPTDLKIITWTGLLDHKWLTRLLIEIIKQTRMLDPAKQHRTWMTMTVTAHPIEAVGNIDGYTLLLHPNHDLSNNDDNTAVITAATTTEDIDTSDKMDIDMPTTMTADGATTLTTTTGTPTVEIPTNEQDTKKPDAKDETKPQHSRGFQRYTCFQFMDS